MLNVGLDKPCNKVSLYISFQKFHPKVLFKSFQKRKLNHSAGRPHEKKKKKKEEEVGLLMMQERIWNNNEEYVGAPGA